MISVELELVLGEIAQFCPQKFSCWPRDCQYCKLHVMENGIKRLNPF